MSAFSPVLAPDDSKGLQAWRFWSIVSGVCVLAALGHLLLYKSTFLAISLDEYARAIAANS